MYTCVVYNPAFIMEPVSYSLTIGFNNNATSTELVAEEQAVARQLFSRRAGREERYLMVAVPLLRC